jgi:hypothetical protein
VHRELNELEYFTWCLGQPNNMVVVVRLRGDLRPDRLRAALDKAQRRHPLLGVNTELGPGGIPRFSSDGVAPIPLAVVDQAEPDDARRLADREAVTPFAMDAPAAARLPLIRVSLLRPRDPARPIDVVFAVQHVIADGLSLVFLVRDLVQLMEDPDAPVIVLDAPARDEEVLPARVLRRIPRSSLRFRIVLWLVKLYVRLRYGRGAAPARPRTQRHRAWELTAGQTDRLRERCRREGVSIHAAICTAFLPWFPYIHTPVNLRSQLARPVGESLGLYVGSANVKMRYRAGTGFWGNARRFHRRLRRKLRDPLRIHRLFSKAVPLAMVQALGPLLVRLTTRGRAFSLTNLRQLDGDGIQLQGRELTIESFFGTMSSIVDASVLLVYTIGGRMRLELLASEAGAAETAIRDDAERAISRLLDAVGDVTAARPAPGPARARMRCPRSRCGSRSRSGRSRERTACRLDSRRCRRGGRSR